MKTKQIKQVVKPGMFIVYNDGRPGHTNAKAVILEVDKAGMVVSFEDRADTTRISFDDSAWMEHIVFSNPAWPMAPRDLPIPSQNMQEFFSRDDVKAQQAIQKRNHA
jgi:hypothetical protein